MFLQYSIPQMFVPEIHTAFCVFEKLAYAICLSVVTEHDSLYFCSSGTCCTLGYLCGAGGSTV